MRKSILFKSLFAGMLIVFSISCSNLFDTIINEDGLIKTGDTTLTVSVDSESDSSTEDDTSSSSGDDTETVVVNDSAADYYTPESTNESTNTEINSGLVVIKATRPAYNQITYSASQYDYEVGNDTDSAYLCSQDDPVLVKTYTSDSHASVSYKAVQTRTTNIANGTLSTSYIADGTEEFVDLDSASQVEVAFTHDSSSSDNLLTFSTLPYGTTLLTITVTADDAYYSDTYTIKLNKKHTLTSLVSPSSTSDTLTKGLVVLKESDGFNENQITYVEGTYDYEVDSLTEDDESLYLKAIPADTNASIEWTASYVASPVYTYTYYQTVTTTVVEVDSYGNLLSGPDTSSETTEVSAYADKVTTVEEESDSSGNTTITSTTTIVRKNISGLDYLDEVSPEDISSCLSQVENLDTDRVRIACLPYGQTIVTAAVTSYDSENPIVQNYTITLTRLQYEECTDSSSSENVSGATVQDDTSKLEDLSVTALTTSDDDGNSVSVESEPSTNFTFDEDQTIYSIVVDEDVDVLLINPTLSDDETMTYPVTKTKYSETSSDSLYVTLQGGLQVITFTVTEEGCEARTYTIYVYKATGNTRLSAINYSSYDCISETTTEESIDSANYSAGVGIFTPSSVYSANGSEDSSSANTYTVNVRADNEADVSQMTFNILPYDSHTHIFYYAGDTSPDEESSDWSQGYLASDSDNTFTFSLNNDGETASTTLWLKTESRAYVHASDLTDSSTSVSARKDITYHKIVISKPGNTNLLLKELIIKTVSETQSQATLYSDLDTSDDDGVTHTVSTSLTKSIGTEIDVAKIYFRLADKDDTDDSKTITYSVNNVRASTTYTSANNDFYQSSVGSQVIDDKTYYFITLGEIEYSGDNASTTPRTTNDLPMGTTTFTISVNGEESTAISFVKPDLDTYTLQAKPAIGSGSYGVYTTSFYDTVYYLNNDVTEVDLTMTTSQKNETIEVTSYSKTAGENGSESTATYDTSLVTLSQSSEAPYTEWTSQVTEIPVGTSQVVYTITSADGTGSTSCTVTFVRAEDAETRLRSYNVSGPSSSSSKQSISDFDWTSSGSAIDDYSYVNNYSISDAETGTYTITALPMNDNQTVSVSVYGSNSSITELTDSAYDVTSSDWSGNEISYEAGSSGTYTFEIAADYKYILVRASVTIGSETTYTHYYDTLLTVALESTTAITACGNQYYNSETTEADTLNYESYETTEESSSDSSSILTTYLYDAAATNVNSNGDIFVDVSKSDKASWIDGYPLVSVGTSYDTSSDITSSITVDSSSMDITIPYSVYQAYAGSTIYVTYMACAEVTSMQEKHIFPIQISELESITTYGTWSSSTTYSYTLPSSVYAKQLAYRFGSEISDSTNIIKTLADDLELTTGGLDVIGSLDYGSSWGATSFESSGMHFLVKAGSDVYLAKLEADSDSSNSASATAFYKITEGSAGYDASSTMSLAEDTGLALSVTADLCYDEETPYLLVQSNLENSSGESVSLAIIMDTLVAAESDADQASNDSVSITETNNGFSMSGSDYTFTFFLKNALEVDDVTRFWYGEYNTSGIYNYLETAFETTTSSLTSDQDSAVSFGWDLGSVTSASKSIRLTVE